MVLSAEQPKKTRRQRLAEQNYKEIIEAAQRVFANNGFYSATMEQVANEAEFAVGTLYRFFKSKDELYQAILEHESKDCEARCREVLHVSGAPSEMIRAYIRMRLDLYLEQPDFYRFYFHEQMGTRINVCAGISETVKERFQRVQDRLAQIFSEGVEKGEFKPADPILLTTALQGMIHGYLAELKPPVTEEMIHADTETLTGIFFNGIC